MANKRLVSVIVAAGVVAAGVSVATAWADGPGGVVDETDISEAVGTGVFDGELVGFLALAATNDQAAASVIAACQAAGVPVEAARIDAIAKAAADGTPIAMDAPIVISDCP